MKLCAILRIKNQIDTIDECMSKLSEIVDSIIVLDNGSSDGTLEKYAQYPKISRVLQTEGFDEGRDKIMLLESAKEIDPDWILWIDADEVFEKYFTREVAEGYMKSKYDRVTFRMCNFWLSKKRCRYDKEYYLYTLHPQRSMWRNMPGTYFKNMKIHNGDIQGVTGKTYISPYRLKHYGYVDRKKIEEKVKIYTAADINKSRDYKNTIGSIDYYKTFTFVEFDNRMLNVLYIYFYKYACNTLWFVERARLKIFKTNQ